MSGGTVRPVTLDLSRIYWLQPIPLHGITLNRTKDTPPAHSLTEYMVLG